MTLPHCTAGNYFCELKFFLFYPKKDEGKGGKMEKNQKRDKKREKNRKKDLF